MSTPRFREGPVGLSRVIGSIIGVGVANALMQGRDGTAGVDWSQAANVGYALLLSPIIGFICAALLLLTLKNLVHKPSLYQEPKGATPPPLWIRAILLLTCTGVSNGTLRKIPTAAVNNVRNDMYLVSEAIRVMFKTGVPALDDATSQTLTAYKGELDDATKCIPLWVKVSVAIALGLCTMIGWKRIVVTVGEKIGKSHLTYAQGASAELVAMATIAGADMFGLPVSTTQVLSSGVAGTIAANGSGLQMATVRNLLMSWVLTLPMAVLLSGSLYWLLSHI
jgi:PiT family inorganic phosphate transporter